MPEKEQPTEIEDWMIGEGLIPVPHLHDLASAKAIQDHWAARLVRRMEVADIPSRTIKIGVGGVDFYVHVGYYEGRAVHIMVDGFKEDDNRQRAPLELLCERVSDNLRRGLVDLEDVLATWRGTNFAPDGPCSKMDGRFAHSPLDAIGWIFSEKVGSE